MSLNEWVIPPDEYERMCADLLLLHGITADQLDDLATTYLHEHNATVETCYQLAYTELLKGPNETR